MRAIVIFMVAAGASGVVCLAVATQIPSYVAENGLLVEPFAWIASGRLLLLVSTASAAMAAGVWSYRKLRA